MKRSSLLPAAFLVASQMALVGASPASPSGPSNPSKRMAIKPDRRETKPDRRETKPDRRETKPERKVKPPSPVTAEQEAAALAFAKANFPELGRLVGHLKKRRPEEYRRAVRDLFRTADRLSKLRQHDKDRYKLELKTWKCKSRIELLTALWKLTPSDKLRAELRKKLVERNRLRLDGMARERDRLAERLNKLDEQIGRVRREQEASIDRLLDKLAPIEKQAPNKP